MRTCDGQKHNHCQICVRYILPPLCNLEMASRRREGGGSQGWIWPPSIPPSYPAPSIGPRPFRRAAQRTKTQSRCIRKIATAAVVGCRVGREGKREGGEPIEKSTRPIALPLCLARPTMLTVVCRHILVYKKLKLWSSHPPKLLNLKGVKSLSMTILHIIEYGRGYI